MKTIEILNHKNEVLATLTQRNGEKPQFFYNSNEGEVIYAVNVERTTKGIYMSFCLAPYNKVIRQFISNVHLRFIW